MNAGASDSLAALRATGQRAMARKMPSIKAFQIQIANEKREMPKE
ncbi:MAG: hypothetical protein VXY13_09240 [Pseudomonadota bacterium]|nr:hypothetical protein [Pseudomonadota bacterium]